MNRMLILIFILFSCVSAKNGSEFLIEKDKKSKSIKNSKLKEELFNELGRYSKNNNRLHKAEAQVEEICIDYVISGINNNFKDIKETEVQVILNDLKALNLNIECLSKDLEKFCKARRK